MDADSVMAGIAHHMREVDCLIEQLAQNALIADEQLVAFEGASNSLQELLEEGC